MFIYIDESGSFAYPKSPHHSYACAGALTIPERRHSAVLTGFKKLKRTWRRQGEEIKGREMNEKQIAQVIDLLHQYGVKFHACVTDMLHNPPSLLTCRKEEQAERLFANITEKHQASLVRQTEEIAEKMRKLPNQLFLQLCMMIELVNAHLRDMIIYFAHEDPYELGSFRWVADQKHYKKTTYEHLWMELLVPFIHGRQFSADVGSKIVTLEGGNYDYCKRFFKRIDKWPDHLPERSPGLHQKKDIEVIDIKGILKESFTLADSAKKPGLQLADVVTNALRRALMGNLQHDGWTALGALMFRWKDKSVRLVHFGDEENIKMGHEHGAEIIADITRKAGFVI
jgi:hypothetical protein